MFKKTQSNLAMWDISEKFVRLCPSFKGKWNSWVNTINVCMIGNETITKIIEMLL